MYFEYKPSRKIIAAVNSFLQFLYIHTFPSNWEDYFSKNSEVGATFQTRKSPQDTFSP